MPTALRAASGSSVENLFISLFEDVFGVEKTGYCDASKLKDTLKI